MNYYSSSFEKRPMEILTSFSFTRISLSYTLLIITYIQMSLFPILSWIRWKYNYFFFAISPLYVDLNLKPTKLKLGYTLSLSQVFYFCLYPKGWFHGQTFGIVLKDSICVIYIYHQDRQPVLEAQKHFGLLQGYSS